MFKAGCSIEEQVFFCLMISSKNWSPEFEDLEEISLVKSELSFRFQVQKVDEKSY